MTTAVQHPEVDETLYVEECVVRVACPKCKMKAGTPCQGARFEWMGKGERRGFRYVQYSHAARQNLFQDWKRNGRPAKIPDAVFETYVRVWGAFSKRLDRKTPIVERTPLKRTTKKTKAAKKVEKRQGLGERHTIEHPPGVVWEAYGDLKMWTWSPYIEFRDYTSVYVHDQRPQWGISVSLRSHDRHECESLEEAFEVGLQLVVQRAFLDVLNERARWRVRELERRFGDLLKVERKVMPVR